MQKQIRINKTREMENILQELKTYKYPLMNENEIVKYLLSKDYTSMIRIKNEPRERTPEEKEEIQTILNRLYIKGETLGKAFLDKKGLKLEDLDDSQLYELIKNA